MDTNPNTLPNATRPLNRKLVRNGINGNTHTVFEMVRVIRNSVDYDLGVSDLAEQILIDNGLFGETLNAESLQAVLNFTKENITYVQDLKGRIDTLKDARSTLRDKWGDADDLTVLNCTLLGCLGFKGVKIALAKTDKDDISFGHVYCVVYLDGERFIFDTSLQNAQLNKENTAYDVKEIPVFEYIKGIDGFSGIYQHVRCHARDLTRFAVKAIPNAVNVLPLGFLAANAFSTGASLIDESIGKKHTLSLPATASNINAELDRIILELLSSKIAYDLAKTQALQTASQLAVADSENENYTLKVVGASIKGKLDFINNFPAYAQQHNIKLVYLDATKMLCAGIVLAGGTGYILYKGWKRSRGL